VRVDKRPSAQAASSSELADGVSPSVLLVDDQPARLLTYESVLEGIGVRCVRALSGKEALARLLHEKFALILLDVSMPEMDGFETARLIRQHPRFEQTPIIFVTGVHVSALDTLRGYEAGAIDYISIPIVPEILRSKVALLVELYRRRAELETLNRALAAAHERLEKEHNAALSVAETQREKDWLAAVLNSISDGIYFTDTRGRFTYLNPAARVEFGSEPVEGVTIAELAAKLDILRPDRSPRPLEEIPAVRALRGEVVRNEEQILRSLRWKEQRNYQVSAAPVRDAKGAIIGGVSVARDITQLREADRCKDEFLATLSHELRNPLAPIRNVAELLSLPGQPEEQRDLLHGVLKRQVAHMTRLLDDLLDGVRISRGQLPIKMELVSLNQVVQGAVEMVRPSIDAKAQQLSVSLPSATVMLDGDLVRLTQVVSNLLANSVKYTPAGGQIGLEARTDAGTVRLTVRDNGIGIPQEEIVHLFTMFSQLESGRSFAQGGLGIGLALAKGIVALHGGSIAVKSDGAGAGSEFTVTLPRLT
jgi:PAS domain S-box-containing protein